MKSGQKSASWLFDIVMGVLIIAAGIYLLVSPTDGSNVLSILVGIGVFIYCVYNIFKAIQSKNDNRLFIPYLAQGLLDIVLLLLLITIPNTPQLVGIIIACWLIVFGFFEIIHARRSDESRHRIRNGTLLILAGVGVLVIPLLLQLHSVIFIGIVGLIIGVVKTVQGLLYKVRTDERTSGGRSNLY
jgi:uncharacterized membrane protein HdeD (DUF308 family)